MRLIATFIAALVLVGPAMGGAAEPAKGSGIAMHGQPRYGADFKHFDYVNPDAPKGGSVRLSDIGSFDNLNPYIIKGESAAGLGLTYDTLTVQSADEAFTEYGLFAETIETPADRSWVQFALRAEARWHDGKPVTADDLLFSFQTLREKGAPFYRFYYASVERAEKIDERTVRFVFKPGDNRELPLILGQLPVLPKHYWEGREFDRTTLEPPLGSGPYRIKSFEPGRRIVYERVADYWGKDLAVNRGRNNFDVMSYDYYRDRTVELEAFKAGQFDFRLENSAKNWATAYDVPAVRDGLLVERVHPVPAFQLFDLQCLGPTIGRSHADEDSDFGSQSFKVMRTRVAGIDLNGQHIQTPPRHHLDIRDQSWAYRIGDKAGKLLFSSENVGHATDVP